MTNQKILKKAIEKACKNGYRHDPDFSYKINEIAFTFRHQPFPLIFSHKFAKVFWGEERHKEEIFIEEPFVEHYCSKCQERPLFNEYCWEYHLQQMVLEKQPLKYLEKFL